MNLPERLPSTFWIYGRVEESFISTSYSSRPSCVSPPAQLRNIEPVTLHAIVLLEEKLKYCLRLLLSSCYPSLSKPAFYVVCAVGQKVLWEKLSAGVNFQKLLACIPAHIQHAWSCREVPMIQRPPFLSEYIVPIQMAALLLGQVEVCMCWSWCTLFLGGDMLWFRASWLEILAGSRGTLRGTEHAASAESSLDSHRSWLPEP